jgi:cation transport regulator ChaC
MKYFAYGSNMDPDRMRRRGVRFSKRERAVLKGWRLEFNKASSRDPKEGYANIVKDEKGIVEGVLYEIPEEDVAKLDRCEGFPEHYGRIRVEVELGDGSRVEAVAYVAQPAWVREGLKPSRGYLEHLLRGSDLLSRGYVERLKKQETLD